MEILLFKLSTCNPCKLVSKFLKELDIPYKEMVIDEDDEADTLADTYEIKSVPTIILLDQGKVIKRITGMQTKEQLKELINNY